MSKTSKKYLRKWFPRFPLPLQILHCFLSLSSLFPETMPSTHFLNQIPQSWIQFRRNPIAIVKICGVVDFFQTPYISQKDLINLKPVGVIRLNDLMIFEQVDVKSLHLFFWELMGGLRDFGSVMHYSDFGFWKDRKHGVFFIKRKKKLKETRSWRSKRERPDCTQFTSSCISACVR